MKNVELTDELKQLFIKNIKTPINELISEGKIEDPNLKGFNSSESNTIKDKHRIRFLNQGRADFTISTNGLTEFEKVDLYCYYYFQMHFSSSYALFDNEDLQLKSIVENKDIVFVDYGCGPLTAGIAFRYWFEQNDISFKNFYYQGFDTSPAMLAKVLLFKDSFGFDFPNLDIYDFSNFCDIARNYNENTIFIINFSYVFASTSINVEQMISFVYSFLLNSNAVGKTYIFHQNPSPDYLNKKWEDFKQRIEGFSPIVNAPQRIAYEYEDVLGSSKYTKPNFSYGRCTRCDVLKSNA